MSEDATNDAPTTTAEELKPGMQIQGTVKHIELYGAFVDINNGQDALLHISQLGKTDVRNVEDVVKVGETITAYVLKVDKDAGRVALSMIKPPDVTWDSIEVGQIMKGTVVRIEKFGAFVDIGAERPGMVHVSEMADGFVKSPSDVVSTGQEVDVRVIKVNRGKRQIDLSMKTEEPEPVSQVFEDESDEEVPTAMAVAFQRAMKGQGDDDRPAARKKSRSRSSIQEDIIARTLKHHNK